MGHIKVESTLHISDTTVKNPFPRTIVGAQDGIRTLCPQSPKSAHQPMDLWASGLIAFWSSGEPGPQGHKPPSTALTSLAEMAHAFAGGTSAICRCPHDPGRAALVSRPRHRLCVLASSLPTPAIEGQGVELSVTTRRGRVLPVLKDCSLRVPPGQLWMLLGPNGCGKSTLLKVLHLLYPPELRRASSLCFSCVFCSCPERFCSWSRQKFSCSIRLCPWTTFFDILLQEIFVYRQEPMDVLIREPLVCILG